MISHPPSPAALTRRVRQWMDASMGCMCLASSMAGWWRWKDFQPASMLALLALPLTLLLPGADTLQPPLTPPPLEPSTCCAAESVGGGAVPKARAASRQYIEDTYLQRKRRRERYK